MTIIEICFIVLTLSGVAALFTHLHKASIPPAAPQTGVPSEIVYALLSVLRDSQRLGAVKHQASIDPLVGRMLAGGYANAMPEAVPPVWHGTPGAQEVNSPDEFAELAAMRAEPTTDIHGNPLKYESVGE